MLSFVTRLIETTPRIEMPELLKPSSPPVASPVYDDWICRLGLPPKTPARTLWVIGNQREAFDSVAPLLARVSREQPRLRTIVSAMNPDLQTWLAQRFPDYPVCALPINNRWLTAAYVRRSNIRAVVMLDDVCPRGDALIRALDERAISLLALTARDGAAAAARPIAAACERYLRVTTTAPARPPDGVTRDDTMNVSPQQAAAILGEIVGRDLKERREARGGSSLFWRAVVDNCARWPLRSRLRRYRDAPELNAALKRPETILCLGNGPSSEQSELLQERYDALFRVNHKWLARGFLSDPDVVFTGSRPAMTSLKRVIFGLQNEHQARRLAAARVFNPARPATGFFNVGDINPRARDYDWGALRPTNGATMIAAAVALQPRRLVVAGIDMFQHPDGSYPGDRSTPNAFSPAHTREAELAFLCAMFAEFRGELVIHGEVLAREWARYRAGHAQTRPG